MFINADGILHYVGLHVSLEELDTICSARFQGSLSVDRLNELFER